MITRKNLNLTGILKFSGHHILWLTAWMILISGTYYFTHWKWLTMPWLPISVIGTAVAFYVGFKNNQAYGRLWEARQVWGAITNSSRMWASLVQSIIGQKDQEAAKLLIYRNIAWTYTLRTQLLQATSWEHVSGWGTFGSFSRNRRLKYGEGAFAEEVAAVDLQKYHQGLDSLNAFSNSSVYILHKQTQFLQKLFEDNTLSWFQQVELQHIISDFYANQGKLERIKKFPLPRQYGSFSFIFVCIFIFLLPFALLGEFHKLGSEWIWLAIPAGVIIGWIYVVMEIIGDYSENPFEGLQHDVPMLSICRTIEIDLLNILEEDHTLRPIQAKQGILM